MGLGTTRRVLCVIFSVLIAFGTAALLSATVINFTLSSQKFLGKYFVTDEIIEECGKQLEMKYSTLEAETGIPLRVFETVKEDYPLDRSITTALDNAFGAENTTLYNKNMVSYFNNLCTEYLDASETAYKTADIDVTAEKAAMIFSDTVGLHGIDSLLNRMDALRNTSAGAAAVAAAFITLGVILIMVVYTDRRRGGIYVLSGITAGAFGTFAGSLICTLFRLSERLNIAPEVYALAAEGLIKTFFFVLAAVSFAVCAVSYLFLIFLYRRSNKKTQRTAVV